MKYKWIEIRDSMTFIPALALRVSGSDSWLAKRAGFGAPLIVLMRFHPEECNYDPYSWGMGARTMPVAHQHLIDNWDDIPDGGLIDVEYVMGITEAPKQSERSTMT